LKVRAIACFFGIALAAFYAGASMQMETRSIRKAYRSPSHGAIELGTVLEQSVIDGCVRFVRPSDVLAVLYTETNPAPDVSPVFILYRLAYLAYPTRFDSATIGEEGIPAALTHLPRKPNWVLLLGKRANVPGYEEVARFSPTDVLLRATGAPQ